MCRKKKQAKACSDSWEPLTKNIPKNKRLRFTKRTNRILPHMVGGTPLHSILMQINPKRQFTSQRTNKRLKALLFCSKFRVICSSHVIIRISKSLNIVIDSHYVEKLFYILKSPNLFQII